MAQTRLDQHPRNRAHRLVLNDIRTRRRLQRLALALHRQDVKAMEHLNVNVDIQRHA